MRWVQLGCMTHHTTVNVKGCTEAAGSCDVCDARKTVVHAWWDLLEVRAVLRMRDKGYEYGMMG